MKMLDTKVNGTRDTEMLLEKSTWEEREKMGVKFDDPSADVRCPRCGGKLIYKQMPEGKYVLCPKCRIAVAERGL